MYTALYLMLVLMNLRVEHVYFIYNMRSVIRPSASGLQLIADDKQQHRQNIRRILTKCTEQHRAKQDQIYLKQKNQQINDVRQYLTTSLNLLTIAQDNLSDYDPCDNMRVSGIQFQNENKMSRLRNKFNKQSDQTRRTHFQSILSQRKSASLKSQASPVKFRKPEKERSLGKERLSLPILMKKLKRTKKPANASKNSSLQYEDSKKTKAEEDVTYQYIRSERQKIEQLRHLTILGRVMGENYKKHLKKLAERKKVFLRNKVHNNF